MVENFKVATCVLQESLKKQQVYEKGWQHPHSLCKIQYSNLLGVSLTKNIIYKIIVQ